MAFAAARLEHMWKTVWRGETPARADRQSSQIGPFVPANVARTRSWLFIAVIAR
jgi:hypothetical protein